MPPVDPTVVNRARWALMTLFVLFGLTNMSWLSRLPSIRAELDVTSAELGGYLVAGAVGALVAVASSGAVITRWGARRVLLAATSANLVSFGLVAAGVATANVPLFVVGTLLHGICGGLINTPINLSAALVEQHLGRAILPHLHAGFSIGAASGALVAAGFSAAGVHVAVQAVVVISIVTVVRLVLLVPATAVTAGPGEEPAEERAATEEASRPRRGAGLRTALSAWREPRTVLIGLVLLAAALSEGAAGNWLAIAVVDGFEAREAVASLAYGTFVVAMTAVRFGGTGLLGRYGRVTVLRASGVSAFVGLLVFGLAPELWMAWLGIVLWGMGAALGNPVCVAAASDEPRRAAARVSVVSSFMSFAQLTAPPLLGLLADAMGARHALLIICAAMVLSVVLAGNVRPPVDDGVRR